jgi:phosphohistidine swiveling domain-containing protein
VSTVAPTHRPTEAPNPVHMATRPETRWCTVNFAEAIQGVQTPLSWGVWNYGMEVACRTAFGAMGVFARSEVPTPPASDDRMSGIFYGRAAGNVDFFHRIGNSMPGTSGDVLEEKLFGSSSGDSGTPLGFKLRYPRVLAKLPWAARRAPRVLPGMLEEYRGWWRDAVLDNPPTDLETAQRLIRESAERFADVGKDHTIVSLLGPQLLEGLADFAKEATGDASLGMELATGFGGMEETQIISDIWAASKGELDLAEIQRRHGFHGPDEGKLETWSWREDPAPVEALMRGYEQQGVTDPRELERERKRRREEVEQQVLEGLPAWKRPRARLTMKLAGTYIPAREIGKAAFLHTLDAARCAARAGGAILADRGLISDPEDVFFLTLDEFTSAPVDFTDRVAKRRADHERYLGLELPPRFQGEPEPIEIKPEADRPAEAVTRLEGVPIVGAEVTGRARVVRDPAAAEFEEGDILVCATTDPSWTPLFMLAAALVIDTGGEISHGAIVARELGVTCVINTGTGTRDIPDGATITVNGSTGTVKIGE